MCTKRLIARDCMEYEITCDKLKDTMYLGLYCRCSSCKKAMKETKNLETCPGCGKKLIKI